MKIKKTKIAGVIATILASSLIAGTAQAAPQASAESIVKITNFVISHDAATPIVGGQQVQASEFDTLTVTSTEKVQASVGAVSDAPVQSSTNVGANLASNATVGTITPANIDVVNNTTTQSPLLAASTSLPIPGGNFAASKANDFGAPIAGFGQATADQATLYNASYAALDNQNGTAGTSSNSGLTAKFSFSGINGVLDFNFNVGAYIAAFLSNPDSVTAKSAYSISFTLERDSDGVSFLDATSNANINALSGVYSVSNNVSDNAPGTGLIKVKSLGNLPLNGDFSLATIAQSFKTLSLLASDTYNLTATITTDANVELNTVPEPEILALLGIGLLGMTVSLGKRKFNVA